MFEGCRCFPIVQGHKPEHSLLNTHRYERTIGNKKIPPLLHCLCCYTDLRKKKIQEMRMEVSE